MGSEPVHQGVDFARVGRARVLYVPTEVGNFRQTGFRRPLADLQRAGLIDSASVFSLRWRLDTGGSHEGHIADLVRRVEEFNPTVVLFQHLGGTGLRPRHFRMIRDAGKFLMIYHEGDPYLRPLHPLPIEARAAGAAADVVFTVGVGHFRQNFIRAGARRVEYAPSSFDSERFAHATVGRDRNLPDADVVVVANRNRPRWRGHPNWRDRIRFVGALERRFGERLAIYGRGWVGRSARGPVAFSEQLTAIRTGWVSANWDHYASEAGYFSNRLPISLSAGTIHATTEHPGYSELFGACGSRPFLRFSPDQLVLIEMIADVLKSTSVAERIEARRQSMRFAQERFRQDNQLIEMLNACEQVVDPAAARACWDDSSHAIDEV